MNELTIHEIARSILSKEKLHEAEDLIQKSQDKNNEWLIIKQLWDILKHQTPDCDINAKQLDYAMQDLEDLDDLQRLGNISRLERKTRSLCWELSQSIEAICATILEECDTERNSQSFLYAQDSSLGKTLNKLSKKNVLDPNTLELLFLFNRLVYNKAKHVIKPNYSGKKHLFSIPVTILVVYSVVAFTRILSKLIKLDYHWRCTDWNWSDIAILQKKLKKNDDKKSES